MIWPWEWHRESRRRLQEARRAEAMVKDRERKVARVLRGREEILERNGLGEIAQLALGQGWKERDA